MSKSRLVILVFVDSTCIDKYTWLSSKIYDKAWRDFPLVSWSFKIFPFNKTVENIGKQIFIINHQIIGITRNLYYI